MRIIYYVFTFDPFRAPFFPSVLLPPHYHSVSHFCVICFHSLISTKMTNILTVFRICQSLVSSVRLCPRDLPRFKKYLWPSARSLESLKQGSWKYSWLWMNVTSVQGYLQTCRPKNTLMPFPRISLWWSSTIRFLISFCFLNPTTKISDGALSASCSIIERACSASMRFAFSFAIFCVAFIYSDVIYGSEEAGFTAST